MSKLTRDHNIQDWDAEDVDPWDLRDVVDFARSVS
jgi:hypothetical protein